VDGIVYDYKTMVVRQAKGKTDRGYDCKKKKVITAI